MTISSDAVLRRDVKGMLNVLLPYAGIGLFAILSYSATRKETAATVGLSVAIAVGATALGSLLGFVFGIPRAFRATPTDASAGNRRYSGNSNLEDVSDWLAKLIIGAGLTQLGQLATSLKEVSQSIAADPVAPTSPAYVLALIIAFGVFGFFLSYLFARRVLPAIFLRADADGDGSAKATLESARLMLDAGVNIKTVRDVLGQPLQQIARTLPSEAASPEDKVLITQARAIAGAPGSMKDLADAAKATPGDAQLQESAVLYALYHHEPDGYRSAIEIGEAVPNKSPRLHMYLAAAWGQKHGARDGDQAASKQKVIEHVKAALGDESLRPAIVAMLDADNHDDDLASLAADPDLKQALGIGELRVA